MAEGVMMESLEKAGGTLASAVTARTYLREVILENFMSHEYSRVKLSPGVNLITGPNGSGKSSILLGISVALGQTYTERGERLSDLIRRGRDAARLTVVLDNTAVNGSRPIRGIDSDTVAITRYVKKSGEYWHYVNNRFRTKAEVDHLLRGIGINPNNMLIIMHQNMIESFAAKNNVEKLQMVEDAVGLSQLREKIIDAEAKLSSLMSESGSVQKLLEEAEEAVNYWRGEAQKLEQRARLESRKRELDLEYAWSLVAQVEAGIEKKRRSLERLRAELEEARRRIEELGRAASQQRSLIEAELASGPLPNRVMEMIDQLVATSVERGVEEYRARMMERDISVYERDIRGLTEELEKRLGEARAVGERVESNRSPEEVLEEIRLTTLQMASIGNAPPEAETLYLLADSRFSEVKSRAMELEENIRRSREEVEMRKEIWRQKLRELVSSVEPIYTDILGSIGAKGKIQLRGLDDIATASIELHVGFWGAEPALLDAHTHSGGERIVATLAFLLALQSHVKSALRAVDEFDVHLDPLNRERMIRMMIETAKKNPGTQHIIITPGRIPVPEGMNILVVQNVSGRSFVTSGEE